MRELKAISSGEELLKEWDYELAYWREEFGEDPTDLLLSEDNSESYEMDRKHLFKLSTKYAVVHESGCSCYEASGAIIDLYPTFEGAVNAYNEI